METNTDTPDLAFAAIYERLTQRFMPASAPRAVNPRVLAIGRVVLAFQHLQDSLQRLTGLFDAPAARAGALAAPAQPMALERLLGRLGLLARKSRSPWHRDLRVLLQRAGAAREVFDLLLFARAPAPAALAAFGLQAGLTELAHIERFADEVGRLDAAFFALGAQHVLERHQSAIRLPSGLAP